MNISELLAAIGNDNVQWQSLDQCADALTMNGDTTRITFGTEQRLTLSGTERYGMVIWLDRQAIADALAKEKAAKAMPASERHNTLAPELVRKLLTGCATEGECMVTLESVILGVMLAYRPDLRHAAEHLDSMTAAVIARMGAKA